jgi:hypothetical protein
VYTVDSVSLRVRKLQRKKGQIEEQVPISITCV